MCPKEGCVCLNCVTPTVVRLGPPSLESEAFPARRLFPNIVRMMQYWITGTPRVYSAVSTHAPPAATIFFSASWLNRRALTTIGTSGMRPLPSTLK